MPTIADLGRMVKQKYPGAYDDMPDDSLGSVVKQKYPGAYDDFEDAPAARPSLVNRLMNPYAAGGAPPFGPENVLATLPAAGATAGGVLGIPGGPLGMAGLGGMGAVAGRGLEQGGRSLLGMQPAPGILESMGVGGDLPPWLKGAIDLAEQGGLGALLEGLPAKAFGVPGRMPGGIQQSLEGVAKKAEGKAARQALEKHRAIKGAGNLSPEQLAAQEAEDVAFARGRARALAASRELAPDEAARLMAEAESRARSRVRATAAARDPSRDLSGGLPMELERVKLARESAGAKKGAAIRGASDESAGANLSEYDSPLLAGQARAMEISATPAELASFREMVARNAGAAPAEGLAAGGGPRVSFNDVVQGIMEDQSKLPGRMRSSKKHVLGSTKKAFKDILKKFSPGSEISKATDFSIEEIDKLKQWLAMLDRPEFSQIARGITPKPQLLSSLRRSLQGVIERKVPDIKKLNKAFGEAAAEHQDVAALSESERGPTVRAFKARQAERGAVAGARASAQPRTVARGVAAERSARSAEESARQRARQRPVREANRVLSEERMVEEAARQDFNRPFQAPHMTWHGPIVPPPTPSRMALLGSKMLARPNVQGPLRYSPDAINMLLRYLGAQDIPKEDEQFSSGQLPDSLRSQ